MHCTFTKRNALSPLGVSYSKIHDFVATASCAFPGRPLPSSFFNWKNSTDKLKRRDPVVASETKSVAHRSGRSSIMSHDDPTEDALFSLDGMNESSLVRRYWPMLRYVKGGSDESQWFEFWPSMMRLRRPLVMLA